MLVGSMAVVCEADPKLDKMAKVVIGQPPSFSG
jgi:hypothetical protein